MRSIFFFSSRRRHTRWNCDWSSDVCSSDLGATCSLFAYDEKMANYLKVTERAAVADLADGVREHLRPDEDVYANPEKYYDQLIEINLNELEPHVNEIGRASCRERV